MFMYLIPEPLLAGRGMLAQSKPWPWVLFEALG